MTYIFYYDSPLGKITVASDGKVVMGLCFEGQKYYDDSIKGETEEKPLAIFDETKMWLDMYFSGKEPDFTPAISLSGTPFKKTVAKIVLGVPYGKTTTYGDIARIIAKDRGIERASARAVGGAVGHNSISLIVPCHRIVGANGSLTGYAGGIDKKIKLLKLEKADMSNFFVPEK